MSSIINTISSEILNKPEVIYDFCKRELKGTFFNLIRFFRCYNFITSEKTEKIEIIQQSDEVYVLIPEWLYWLLYAHGGYNKLKFKTEKGEIDEWHLAKMFIYKTIEENYKSSINKLKNGEVLQS